MASGLIIYKIGCYDCYLIMLGHKFQLFCQNASCKKISLEICLCNVLLQISSPALLSWIIIFKKKLKYTLPTWYEAFTVVPISLVTWYFLILWFLNVFYLKIFSNKFHGKTWLPSLPHSTPLNHDVNKHESTKSGKIFI